VGLTELRAELARLRSICIDTAVFAYHFAADARYVAYTAAILAAVEQKQLEAITTTVTLIELLTYPAQKGDLATMQEWELYLTNFPNLRIVALDELLAHEAAIVRAQTRLRTPDAVQVAAARLYGVEAIVSNDRDWNRRVASPRVLILEDFAG
jgi:predicted nucleic acid-binding protein